MYMQEWVISPAILQLSPRQLLPTPTFTTLLSQVRFRKHDPICTIVIPTNKWHLNFGDETREISLRINYLLLLQQYLDLLY